MEQAMEIETMRFTVRHTPPWPSRGRIHHVGLNLLDIQYNFHEDELWVDCWLEWLVQVAMPDERIRSFREHMNLQGKTGDSLHHTIPASAQVILENFIYAPSVSSGGSWFEMEIQLNLFFSKLWQSQSPITGKGHVLEVWAPCQINSGCIQHRVFWETDYPSMDCITKDNLYIDGDFRSLNQTGLFTGCVYWTLDSKKFKIPFTLMIPIKRNNEKELIEGRIQLINVDKIPVENNEVVMAFLVEIEWWVTVPRELRLNVSIEPPEDDAIRLRTIVDRREVEIAKTIHLPPELHGNKVLEIECALRNEETRHNEKGWLFNGVWKIAFYYSGQDGQEHHTEMTVPWEWWWEMINDCSSSDYGSHYEPVRTEIQGDEILIMMNARFLLFKAGLFLPLTIPDGVQEKIMAERHVGQTSIPVWEEVKYKTKDGSVPVLATQWHVEVEEVNVFDGWISIKTIVEGIVDIRDESGILKSYSIRQIFLHSLNLPKARRSYNAQVDPAIEYYGIKENKDDGQKYLILLKYNIDLWERDAIPVYALPTDTKVEQITADPIVVPTTSIEWEETLPIWAKRVLSTKFWLSCCHEELRAQGRFVEGEIRSIIEWEDGEGYLRRSDFLHPFWQIWEDTQNHFGMTVIKGGGCRVAPRWVWGAGQLKFTVLLQWVKLPNLTKEEWGDANPHLIRRRGAAFASADKRDAKDLNDHGTSNSIGTLNPLAAPISSRNNPSLPGEKR